MQITEYDVYPGHVVKRYCWRRRCYVEQAVGNLGRTIPVSPADYDALMEPEYYPGISPKPTKPRTHYGGIAKAADVIADLLAGAGEGLSAQEIVQITGRKRETVERVLREGQGTRFHIVGHKEKDCVRPGNKARLWALAEQEGAPDTTEAELGVNSGGRGW